MSKRNKARIIALQSLYQYDLNPECNLDSLLKLNWTSEKKPLLEEVKLFAQELIQGTLLHEKLISEYIIKYLPKNDLTSVSPIIRSILKFSTYSLIFQPEIHSSVTINEAIQIAKRFGNPNCYKIVNGVLNSILNELKLKKYEIN